MKTHCPLWFLLALMPSLTTAQQNEHTLDSLRKELNRAKADTSRMWLMFQLGAVQSNQNLDSARWYAQQTIQLARKAGHTTGELNGLDLLSYTLSERDIPQSMQITLQERHLAERLNHRFFIRNTYYQSALLNIYLENFHQALTYFKLAKNLALQDNDKLSAARSSSEQASVYIRLEKPDSARYYLAIAAKENPALKQNPYYLYNWGRLETIDHPTKARSYFHRSIQLLKAQQDLRGLSLAYRWYSEFFWKQHQPDSSVLMAKNGLQVSQTMSIFRQIFYNSRLLVTYYQALGQPDSAYKYQSSMIAARDSLFSQQKFNQIQNTLIDEQQRVQRLEEEKSEFKSQVKIYGLLGIMSGLLLLAGVLYRNNRQKQKTNSRLQVLNHEIEHQKEEIETQRDYLEEALNDLKTTQTQLIQKEKLASLGELTAGIAHEIQNPLNFVNNFSEVSSELIEELKEGPFQQLPDSEKDYAEEILGDLTSNLQKINHHGGRASSIVKGMLEHSRTESGEKRATDLNALADEYFKIAYHGLKAKDKPFNCELVTQFDPTLKPIEAAPQEIGRVLLNLYNNAFYAVSEQTKKTNDPNYKPTVKVQTQQQGHQLMVQVKDNGIGIPDSVKAKIFQPFFTTKPTGEGTGLGLSLSYDIITKGYGGTLRVESQVGEGTKFVIELPLL